MDFRGISAPLRERERQRGWVHPLCLVSFFSVSLMIFPSLSLQKGEYLAVGLWYKRIEDERRWRRSPFEWQGVTGTSRGGSASPRLQIGMSSLSTWVFSYHNPKLGNWLPYSMASNAPHTFVFHILMNGFFMRVMVSGRRGCTRRANRLAIIIARSPRTEQEECKEIRTLEIFVWAPLFLLDPLQARGKTQTHRGETKRLYRKGIFQIVGGSLAERAGLRDGDVISELEGLRDLDINAVDRLLVTSREKIELVIYRWAFLYFQLSLDLWKALMV